VSPLLRTSSRRRRLSPAPRNPDGAFAARVRFRVFRSAACAGDSRRRRRVFTSCLGTASACLDSSPPISCDSTNSQGTRTVMSVAPDVIRNAPAVTRLPVFWLSHRAKTPPLADDGTLWREVDVCGVGQCRHAFGGGLPLSEARGRCPWRRRTERSSLDAVYLPPGLVPMSRDRLSGGNVRAGTRYFVSTPVFDTPSTTTTRHMTSECPTR